MEHTTLVNVFESLSLIRWLIIYYSLFFLVLIILSIYFWCIDQQNSKLENSEIDIDQQHIDIPFDKVLSAVTSQNNNTHVLIKEEKKKKDKQLINDNTNKIKNTINLNISNVDVITPNVNDKPINKIGVNSIASMESLYVEHKTIEGNIELVNNNKQENIELVNDDDDDEELIKGKKTTKEGDV